MKIDNFHSDGHGHPAEDVAGHITDSAGGVFAVFDGVTLLHYDPYPDPSPAAIAARRAVEAVKNGYRHIGDRKISERDMRELMVQANDAIQAYNNELGTTPNTVDFLRRQYAAAVGAAVVISGHNLHAAQINDTELCILNQDGDRVYHLASDKTVFYQYLRHLQETGALSKGTPEEHHYIRSKLVNHEDVTYEGRSARSGVFTGEQVANNFIMTGEFRLEPTMIVLVYSDGFLPLLKQPGFCHLLASADSDEINRSIAQLEKHGAKYRSEKTMIRIRV